MSNEDYTMVQALDITNVTVVPIYSVCVNAYILWTQIPSNVQLSTGLDVKDVLFCTSLASKNQLVFDIEWADAQGLNRQFTYGVPHWSFKDRSHTFGQDLAKYSNDLTLDSKMTF